MRKVTRTRMPSRKSFERMDIQAPVIFTGHRLSWSADPLQYLERKIGDKQVGILESDRSHNNRKPFTYKNTNLKNFTGTGDVRKLSFREFAQELRDGANKKYKKTLYMQSMPISDKFPELLSSTRSPLVPRIPGRIWVGNGQRVGIHFDPAPNLAYLASGRKRFILFPPEELANMYMGPLDKTPYGPPISLVDLWNPDFKKFPKFKKALKKAWVADMKEGDTLFVPAYWWHAVESWDLNILINYWWDEGGNDFFGLSFLGGLLTVRQYPDHLKKIWETFFEHFVIQKNGDPYAHLPKNYQGIAGTLSKKRAEELIQKIEDRLKGVHLEFFEVIR